MPLAWHIITAPTGEAMYCAESGRLHYQICAVGQRRFLTAVFKAARNGTRPPQRWPVELASLSEAKLWCQRYDDRCGAYANRTHRPTPAAKSAGAP